MFAFRASIKGQGTVLRALRAWFRSAPAALSAALFEEGQEWGTTADKLSPEQDGELRGSLFVSRPTDRNPAVEVGFGARHAARVHARERTATGTPHWLEVTMRKHTPGMTARLLDRTKRNIAAKRDARSESAQWPVRPSGRRGASPKSGRGRKG